jgi:formylglycine-generating enzyme required for sulfatase activity
MSWRLKAGAAVALPLLFAAQVAAAAGETHTFRDCPTCPVMTEIPGGVFSMGAEGGEPGRPEGPVREVAVPAFAIGVYEVTQAQFEAFVEATGHRPGTPCRVWPDERMEGGGPYDWRDPGYGRPPQADEPVACVSWLDASAYVDWLAAETGLPYRLPSEAEWEYAARAGTGTAFHWGDDPEDGCVYANMHDRSGLENGFGWAAADCDDGFPIVAPVGSLAPNAFGLHDMLGNVWEWVEDCYEPGYTNASTDGAAAPARNGACERRSVRGGSWITRPSRNRSAFRGRDPEPTLYFMFGFRVARDLVAGTP